MTSGWRRLFQLEIVICVATALYWILAPRSYLEALFVDPHVDGVTRYLVLQGAGVLLCAWGYLYARLLLQREFSEASFRHLQEAMAIGDVFVLVTSFLGWRDSTLAFRTPTFAAQVVMAALWLAIRVVYLWVRR